MFRAASLLLALITTSVVSISAVQAAPPDSGAGAVINRAQLCVSTGKRAEALRLLQTARAKQPTAVQCARIGALYSGMGEQQLASKWVEEQLLLHPDSVDLLIERARVNLNKNPQKSFQVLDQIIQGKSPRVADACALRAMLNLSQERMPQAEDDAKRLLQLRPNDAQALLTLGEVRRHERKFAESLSYFDKTINAIARQEPKKRSKQALISAYVGKGSVHRDENELPAAIRDATKALAIDPNSLLALTLRGVCYRKINNYKKSLEDFDRALKIDPRYEMGYFQRAVTWSQMKQLEASNADVEKAIKVGRANGASQKFIDYCIQLKAKLKKRHSVR